MNVEDYRQDRIADLGEFIGTVIAGEHDALVGQAQDGHSVRYPILKLGQGDHGAGSEPGAVPDVDLRGRRRLVATDFGGTSGAGARAAIRTAVTTTSLDESGARGDPLGRVRELARHRWPERSLRQGANWTRAG